MPILECRSELLPLLAYMNEERIHFSQVRIVCEGKETGLALHSILLKTKLMCIMDLHLDAVFKFCQGGLSCMANWYLHCYKS